MDGENLKIQIGLNIAELRRQREMTQAELAERLNYSDKAVSKWERGESLPDVMTLMELARLFGVTVDALLSDVQLPDAHRRKRGSATYHGVLRLSSLLVWFVALMVYVVLSSTGVPKSWMAFIYAVPVNAIVLLVLCSSWRDFQWNELLISVIAWGTLLSIYLTLLVFAKANVWKLVFPGLLGQAAIYLWFRMLRGRKKQSEQDRTA